MPGAWFSEQGVNSVKTKKRSEDDFRDVVITDGIGNGVVLKEAGRKKMKMGKAKNGYHVLDGKHDELQCNPCPVEIQTPNNETRNNCKSNKGNSEENKDMKDKSKNKASSSNEVDMSNELNCLNIQKSTDEQNTVVRGKRFSTEEDDIVKQAVYKYIEDNCLGEGGLNMVLNCRSHREVRGCWKHIAKALPHRPQQAIYWRAHILFKRGEKRKFTAEEFEQIKKFHEDHGNKWTLLADELGRHRCHINHAWRRNKLRGRKKGRWSQDEYQALFDLVNTDLRLKVSEGMEKKSKCGMLRDNIRWTAISESLGTRLHIDCCWKWYHQLTSPMVAEGLWADTDDYHLINQLFSLDACCIEDIDWDNLLDHRGGDACRNPMESNGDAYW